MNIYRVTPPHGQMNTLKVLTVETTCIKNHPLVEMLLYRNHITER